MMLSDLERAFCSGQSTNLSERPTKLISLYHAGQFAECRQLAESCFQSESASDSEIKAFWLHLICVILEINYDLEARELWMMKWHSLLAETNHPFVVSAHNYHLAVTCYFSSHYSECEARFNRLALAEETPTRLRALSHFHLGLIYRDQIKSRGASKEFRLALDLARKIDHLKLAGRAQIQLTQLEKQFRFPLLDSELCDLLSSGWTRDFRRLYLGKRNRERKAGVTRDSNTLHALLPAAAFMTGRLNDVEFLLNKVTDPVVKVQAIEFLRDLGYSSSTLLRLSEYLRSDLKIQARAPARRLTEDVERLFRLLESRERVSKVDICKAIWDLDYDPFLHDSRIYKLIHKLRDQFGRKDIVDNNYGTYQLSKARPTPALTTIEV